MNYRSWEQVERRHRLREVPKDSNLPSVLSFAAANYVNELQLLWDCWNDLKDVEKKYLPIELKEPPLAYANRVKRTVFDNRFEPALRDYAGLLSVFSLNDEIAASIKANINNIDQQGNDLWTFFHEADQMTLRDGWCGIMVEYPPQDDSIQSQADFIASDRRPYLVVIDRRDILNWQFTYVNGKPILTRITIQERRLEPDGDFGESEGIYYRVLTRGEYAVYQILDNAGVQYSQVDNIQFVSANSTPPIAGNSKQLVLVESGTTSLQDIPLVYYSVTQSVLFSAKAPFLNLAKMNIEHYQKRSQLNEVLRKCNLPVPVRKGLIATLDDVKKAPPLVIGPNSVVDIPVNGDFFFAEPSGVAIAATQSDIEKLERSMDRTTLDFLTGGEHQKTATEVVLDSSKTSANLKGIARRKESAIQQIFQFWIQYTGEPDGGGIQMDESLLQMPLDPNAVDKLESLAEQGFISHRTLLILLQLGKILPRQFDIDAELEATQHETPRETLTLEPTLEPGNDHSK